MLKQVKRGAFFWDTVYRPTCSCYFTSY